MTGYHVPVAMRGEVNLQDLGSVAYEFDAGVVAPKDATEAAVLEALAVNGLVSLAEAAKPAKPKPAKTEPETDKE